MFSNIIYVLATSCLLAGSCISFYRSYDNKLTLDEIDSYLYLIGTILFFIKATFCLINEIISNKQSLDYKPIKQRKSINL